MRKMINSGVEWIGEIADTHTIFRLKYLLQSPMQYGANESGDKITDDSVRYIRITDITAEGNLKDDDSNQYLPITVAEEYILEDKDVLFARSGGTVGKSFLYHEIYGTCAFAGYLIKAKCDQSVLLPEYLIYYTQSSLYELWKNMIFVQATIQNIGANKYSNMEIPVPSIGKQASIVSCLDEKCSQINALIANVQAQIEKLKAYKQSLITEVVTKGLDSTVPMKDSGVEWIGTIPEHWGTVKLQYCARIRSGITLGKKYPKGTEMIERPYLRVANVQSGGVVLDNLKTVEVSAEDDLQYRLSAGEILMTEGGDRDKLGRGCVWQGQIDPCLHQNHIFALQTNELLDPQFLAYMTASDVGRVYFDITAIKTTNLACTNSSKVLAFRFPLPKMPEQLELVAYLDKKCAQIDRLIAIKQEKIEKLEQYKRSLIYEYVTGKKEVTA